MTVMTIDETHVGTQLKAALKTMRIKVTPNRYNPALSKYVTSTGASVVLKLPDGAIKRSLTFK